MFRYLRNAALGVTDASSAKDAAQVRSRERYRLAAWNSLANLASSAIGMVSVFLVIRLVLPHLGAERFGVWMTISSLATMLSFMDFGVGNGLVNLVARAKSQEQHRLRQVVSRGLGLLILIGLVVGAVLMLLTWLFPLGSLIKISSEALRVEAHEATLVFVAIFAAGIPLFGVQRIFFGLQKSWLTHLVKIIGHALSCALVYLLVEQHTSLALLLMATYGVQTLLTLLLLPALWKALHDAGHSHTGTKVAIPVRNDLSALAGLSGIFFALQIGGIVGWGSDALIAASVLGASTVAALSIAQRLFQFVTIPLTIVNGPLWAAYADAHARGDTDFIRRTLHRSLALTSFAAITTSMGLLAASNWLISLWLGPGHTPAFSLLFAFAVWSAIDAIGNCFAMYLNGCNIVKAQLVVIVLFCMVAIPLKLLLPLHLGLSGILIATIVAYVCCVVLPYASFLKGSVLGGLTATRSPLSQLSL